MPYGYFIEPLAGVYKPVITQPLQNWVFLLVELCAIIFLVWAGPLVTGLDTPIKGPSDIHDDPHEHETEYAQSPY